MIRKCVAVWASSVAAAIVLTATLPLEVRAQCADGTPGCKAGTAAPAPKRVDPPLDAKTWIVVPFENTTRAADIDWLRDASVNLLYRDLSRWNDIKVVDDKRVADFLREVPTAGGAQKLSLNDALAVAKRAGAGNLVMGDVLKLGNRTTVNATVFDVKKGERVRSVQQEAVVQDSLLPLFGKLARDILRVAPPSGATIGDAGTTRVDAFQDYLAGVQALNRFDIIEAKKRFDHALQLDTAFALAHYKWAIASTYDEAAAAARMAKVDLANVANVMQVMTEDAARDRHAAAAARLSGTLPPRERALINGLLAHIRADYARACATYGALVKADSSDVEALFGLGECLYKDDVVEAIGGDTTKLRFRSSWNAALTVLRRTVTVDPTFHLAFNDVLAILSASSRLGCRRDDQSLPCTNTTSAMARTRAIYLGTMGRNGDSLTVVPGGTAGSSADVLLAMVTADDATGARRQNLEAARVAAQEWVAAGPGEARAHKALAGIFLRLGRLAEAEAQLAEATRDRSVLTDPDIAHWRIELALKSGRGGEVIHLLDSLRGAWTDPLPRVTVALFNPMVGRVHEADSVMVALLKQQSATLPPVIARYFNQSQRIVLGASTDSVAAVEAEVMAMFGKPGVCGEGCLSLLSPSWSLGLGIPRPSWPTFDSTARGPRLAPAVAMSRGDTAALRTAARSLDSASRVAARMGGNEGGGTLQAAHAFLILHDTAAALAAVRRMLDTTLMNTQTQTPLGAGISFTGAIWPHAMLLRADLAAATKRSAEAKLWYKRFIDLWAKAEPEFQPTVDRAKKAYAALGG